MSILTTVYLLKLFNSANLPFNQEEKAYQTLNKAKQALIAWSVSHSKRPGQMPFPDRNADGNYDGNSDCNSPVSTFSYSFLLGQLPILGQTNPCISPQVGLGENFKDAGGNKLWYAVSRNLVHKYENFPVTPTNDPIINPDIINNPTYPWLIVLDANANVISNRVAVVIIAPGNTIGNQNRSATAPSPNQYLDSFTKNSISYSNAIYDAPDHAFVTGQDSRTAPNSDLRYNQPYYFNDKLVYITIDELMLALNARAAAEASHLLNQYKAKAGQFPYAADLGSTGKNHTSSAVSQKGFVPIDGTDDCSCESANKCTCNFKAISKVVLTRGSGTWAATTNACSRYSANCTCTGQGSCTNGAEKFVCDTAGICEHNLSGSNTFKYTVPDYADITRLGVDHCADPSGKQINCDGSGAFRIGLDAPTWFKDNLWQDFLYYEWTSANDLTLGQRTGLSAIIIGAGAKLTNEFGVTQSRPSNNISDYLDSTENTNGDQQFDAAIKKKTTQYNDQAFIIAP